MYAGNAPLVYIDPSGSRKQNGGCGWAKAIGGGVKDGFGAVAKTPGALYDATIAFPTNVRKLPAGIAAACNEYRSRNGGLGSVVQCGIGVVATGTGIDALANAMVDCLDYSVPGMSASECQCMTRHRRLRHHPSIRHSQSSRVATNTPSKGCRRSLTT